MTSLHLKVPDCLFLQFLQSATDLSALLILEVSNGGALYRPLYFKGLMDLGSSPEAVTKPYLYLAFPGLFY